MKTLVSACLIVASCSVCLAEKNATLPTVLAKPGKIILKDDFERKTVGVEWKQVRGEWNIVDGQVVGKELKSEKHAAVFHCLKKNRNSIVRFSFKLSGAKGFHFSLNHTKGHLFRILVAPESVTVRTDADKKDKSIKSELIGKAKGKFQQNKWYTMQVEMVGDKVCVVTDNGVKVSGSNKRLDTAKPNYRFILKDEFLVIDDVKIWEAK